MMVFIGLLGIFSFVVWVVTTARSDGKALEKLKQEEAINEQDDRTLIYLKREKDFADRLRRDPNFCDRVRRDLEDTLE